MQIAIDASRTTVRQRTGTENYALRMIQALLRLKPPHDISLYFRDEPPPELVPDYPNVTCRVIPFWRMWTHLRFAAELWRTQPDVTWVPAHTLPRVFPGKGVVTVHDLGYLYYPRLHTERDYRYLDWSTKYSAGRAARIMADSETTRQDLIKYYKISPEKIDVVYPGVDESLHVVHDSETLAALRKKYGLPERYLLFIGTLQPRKNVGRLIKAFHQWRTESGTQNQDIVLALAGRPGWLYDPSWQEGVENIEVLGYVEDEDISALYSGALAFLMPSLFEGFGFPILEAMRCETPVMCSSTSSLPELAGDAAVLVDPIDVKAISASIDILVSDAKLRAALVERGKVQAAKFTWEAAARNAMSVLEKA